LKINQVEELVGITKKNIRFYEAQGLLNPERDPQNGYREYTMRDVQQLEKVKLLRKLDIPCEKIRSVMEGRLPLSVCLRDQQDQLEKRTRDLTHMQELCGLLSKDSSDLDSLDAAGFLEKMKTLEQGGVMFVDTNRSDVSRRRIGAIASAAVCILVFAALIGLLLYANSQDPAPTAVLIYFILILLVIIVGVALALRQRMKELKGGELDEARKY